MTTEEWKAEQQLATMAQLNAIVQFLSIDSFGPPSREDAGESEYICEQAK
ncbi:MAG TPA: hypothetical protein VFB60_14455 [Ktedonobacteraceae bacterium]|nr:hypothetical protein [Ktedonobacteraceae bacterium]